MENARAMVAPEGRIIYITCSFLASEGQEQIKNLMVKAPELELVRIEKVWERTVLALGGGNCPPTDGKFLQLTPGKNRTDGFFIAILRACHAY